MGIKEKYKNKEWYEESAEGNPVFASLAGQSLRHLDPLEKQYSVLLIFCENNRIWWLTPEQDQDVLSDEIISRHRSDRKWLEGWFSEWKKHRLQYEKLYEEVKSRDLSQMPDEELFDLHKRAWQTVLKCRKIDMIIDPFILGSERKMTEKLGKFCKENGIKDINRIYTTLILPERESFIRQKEIELIEMAKRISTSEELMQLLDKPAEFSKLDFVKEHMDRYCWIKSNWGGYYEYAPEDVMAGIRDVLEGGIQESEKRMKGIVEENIKRKRELIRKHKFNQDIIDLAELTAFFSYWQDLRKENALMYVHYETLFLREFARRFTLEYDDLKLFDNTEIETLIKSGRLQEEARKRKSMFLLEYLPEELRAHHDNVREYFNIIVNKSLDNEKGEIKGNSANPGKATGRARIIHEQKDFGKFSEGDVLVTGMTRPEFTPIMKKAKAIVTNEGGITCHAAIFSREFDIPCIIGTRTATKVLKDGDMIEVNADKGVVKKLE